MPFTHLRTLTQSAIDRVRDARHDYTRDATNGPFLNSQHRRIVRTLGPDAKPHYAWGVLQGLALAKALGTSRVSVAEFDVAGGAGLVALEQISAIAGPAFGIDIDVYGFDAGTGLPNLDDYRDAPNLFTPRSFPMDEEKLRSRLSRAHLLLGDVGLTVQQYAEVSPRPAPLAFVAFDLDLYSSTRRALRIFDAVHGAFLPRVYCYFDDTLGLTYNEHGGVLLAIREFNNDHDDRKISQIRGLRYYVSRQFQNSYWTESLYLFHDFQHPDYNRHDGTVRAERMDL